MTARTQLASWQKLEQLAASAIPFDVNKAFNQDPSRFDKYHIELDNLLFDYSKNFINDEVLATLLNCARECRLEQARDSMFAGSTINKTENRAVLHTALRSKSTQPLMVEGHNVRLQVTQELAKIERFVERVHLGHHTGYSNKVITDIVSIGVGGSNLGPEMVCQALTRYALAKVNAHFVSNVDGEQISQVLATINPETTLFIVASKTFTTSETMTNANTAKQWLVNYFKSEGAVAKHFVAVSSNLDKVAEFGIASDHIFAMWDWVGGRFSMWSAIALPIALYIGFDHFKTLLEGGESIDQHFINAPLAQNIPVIMALLSFWHASFLGHQSQVILPYDQALARFPAYLQQAEMESNGKSVSTQGESLPYPTVAALWGEIGINGQHAFYQYLHQSNAIVPADFIGSIASHHSLDNHQQVLMANFFAQSQGLMTGVSQQAVEAQLADKGLSASQIQALAPHKVHQGNKPSNTILLDKLTPFSLGQLVALYEHKIFCQGVLLDIHSFDQWGVELGKVLAKNIEQQLNEQQVESNQDSSTRGLLSYYLAKQAQFSTNDSQLGELNSKNSTD
ncbi:glucose-6-phosphate isomerase [Thalassotalea sp. LPB0316]|uniref:glucose-6-phosphate isomerase n=1 Tax=Thalassotalea sp. LPB0316 TaxID=2769490 RepID=UPI001867551E|nr:glucose-6-phosphate isomerase [Thalassotalea sp. LPB0316]QOL25525.1 glucose-6-phosphate isomerase [Thalassotalea sp. LPB0316]